jgi:hypothetical protein
VIPGSVTSIGAGAFANCTSLIGIYFLGDAPRADLSPFGKRDYVTSYYLPGTTGWESTFGGRPTALWLPQVQIGDASFGIQTNQFGFTINRASGMTVVVDASTDLLNPTWTPVATNTLSSGSAYFSDPQWTKYPSRFYRLRWP